MELDELRWTGRTGYGARTFVGACLVESLYAIPTWTRVSALIAEHRALADSIGARPSESLPDGECNPKSKWVKGSRRNPFIPRESKRWGNLYRGRATARA